MLNWTFHLTTNPVPHNVICVKACFAVRHQCWFFLFYIFFSCWFCVLANVLTLIRLAVGWERDPKPGHSKITYWNWYGPWLTSIFTIISISTFRKVPSDLELALFSQSGPIPWLLSYILFHVNNNSHIYYCLLLLYTIFYVYNDTFLYIIVY